MSSLLDVRSLSCGYQNQVIVSSLDFSVGEGEIACLLGPSGCGKTTVLRAVAGFSPVFGGEISLEGKTISSAEFTLVPEKRGMGMVFQDYALFPHLTVGENIRFGLGKSVGKNQKQRIGEMLDVPYPRVLPTSSIIRRPKEDVPEAIVFPISSVQRIEVVGAGSLRQRWSRQRGRWRWRRQNREGRR